MQCGGHDSWTAVCEFNRFFLSETAPDTDAMRADYAICHRCGVVFARRRPIGERFRYSSSISRKRSAACPPMSSVGPRCWARVGLSEDEPSDCAPRATAADVRQRVPADQGGRQHLPQLLEDRLAVAAHVEIIGSLLPLESPRVLEIRPRSARLARRFDGLRRRNVRAAAVRGAAGAGA